MTLPMKAAAEHIEVPPPAAPEEPGPFSLADADRVRKILGTAGFTEIEVKPDDRTAVLNEDGLDADVESRFDMGPLTRLMDDATDEQRELVRGSVREALAPYYEPNAPKLVHATWIVTAKAS